MKLILHNNEIHFKIIARVTHFFSFSYSFEVMNSLIIKIDIH